MSCKGKGQDTRCTREGWKRSIVDRPQKEGCSGQAHRVKCRMHVHGGCVSVSVGRQDQVAGGVRKASGPVK